MTPKQFYASKAWRSFRLALIAQRGGRCQKCGRIANPEDLHAHHIIPITPDNIMDARITLNPDNVLILCIEHHNEEHARFMQIDQKVFIIWGPPMGGAREYVQEQAGQYDLIIDIDSIYAGISNNPLYYKPGRLYNAASGVYNYMVDMIRTRANNWSSAWIIGGYPIKAIREREAKRLGAELIRMEATKEDCLLALSNSGIKEQRAWQEYINNYFLGVEL